MVSIFFSGRVGRREAFWTPTPSLSSCDASSYKILETSNGFIVRPVCIRIGIYSSLGVGPRGISRLSPSPECMRNRRYVYSWRYINLDKSIYSCSPCNTLFPHQLPPQLSPRYTTRSQNQQMSFYPEKSFSDANDEYAKTFTEVEAALQIFPRKRYAIGSSPRLPSYISLALVGMRN